MDNITLKENKVERITVPNFKTYKATVPQKMWYSYQNRCVDQWSRIKIPEIDPLIFGQ